MIEAKKNNGNSDHSEDHSRKAYQGIRRMLYRKEIVPGQKISCRAVAGQLGMSLTPIIQALKQMEFQGFVRHEANRGYFMTPFSIKELEEIYDFRLLLETALIPQTIACINDNGLAQLKNALEAHASTGGGPFDRSRLFRNVEFHLSLASLSNMETQVRFLRQIYNLLYLKYGGDYFPVSYTRSVVDEHQKIFDAVCSRDIEKAQAYLSEHICRVKEQVLSSARKMSEQEDIPEF